MAKIPQSNIQNVRPTRCLPPDDINRDGLSFEQTLKRGAPSDLTEEQLAKKRKLRQIKLPVFKRLTWSNRKLGTLGVLPDEVLVEVCKYLIPSEVMKIDLDRSRRHTNQSSNNSLDFMRASSKLHAMGRELDILNDRTYTIAFSDSGYSFENYLNCPSKVVRAVAKHVKSIKLLVELDLGGLIEQSYFDGLEKAYEKSWKALIQLKHTRLDRFDIEFYIKDSKYVPGEPFQRPRFLENRDIVSMEGWIRTVLMDSLTMNYLRVGRARIMSQPLTYHPHLNCSGSLEKHAQAKAKWRRVQMAVDAASYLFSGFDEQELKWCGHFMRLTFFDKFRKRIDDLNNEPEGSQRPPIYDDAVRNRCRCQPYCFHVL